MERRNGPGRYALSSRGGATTSADARFGHLAGRDVGLSALDVAELEGAGPPTAEQRLDVGLDPASIHRQCGGFDGAPPPAKDAGRLGFGHIPIGNLGDGQEPGCLGFSGDWIDALGDGNEFLMREGAGLRDGHQPVAPDNHPPGAAPRRAILNDEALEVRWRELYAEAREFAVPQETLPNLYPNLGRFRSFQGIGNPIGELLSSHIRHVLEFRGLVPRALDFYPIPFITWPAAFLSWST
jgi:hypothetical protein